MLQKVLGKVTVQKLLVLNGSPLSLQADLLVLPFLIIRVPIIEIALVKALVGIFEVVDILDDGLKNKQVVLHTKFNSTLLWFFFEVHVVPVLLELSTPLFFESFFGDDPSVLNAGILPVNRTIPFSLHDFVDVSQPPCKFFRNIFIILPSSLLLDQHLKHIRQIF